MGVLSERTTAVAGTGIARRERAGSTRQAARFGMRSDSSCESPNRRQDLGACQPLLCGRLRKPAPDAVHMLLVDSPPAPQGETAPMRLHEAPHPAQTDVAEVAR